MGADFRADFRGESICRLSWKVFSDFGGNNYTDSQTITDMISSGHFRSNFRSKFYLPEFFIAPKVALSNFSGSPWGSFFLYGDHTRSYHRKIASWRKSAEKRRNC